MNDPLKPTYKSLGRIVRAVGHSFDGLRHAASNESAFQQELILLAVMSIVCLSLPLNPFLKVLILISHFAVLIVELLNTAIEALADKVCIDIDPLIKQAKDTGSAAVLLTMGAAALLWGYGISTLV